MCYTDEKSNSNKYHHNIQYKNIMILFNRGMKTNSSYHLEQSKLNERKLFSFVGMDRARKGIDIEQTKTIDSNTVYTIGTLHICEVSEGGKISSYLVSVYDAYTIDNSNNNNNNVIWGFSME